MADCLDELLDALPSDIAFSAEWLRNIHWRIAGDLFPEWAGRFRTTDVQVGTHLPPPAYKIAVEVENFCRDLEERLHHAGNADTGDLKELWLDRLGA